MKIILATLIAALMSLHAPARAATAVNLQVCTVTPGSSGLIGCPAANVAFAAVTPTTLVRSQVNGVQGWRAFANLQPADMVVSADGAWHALSTLTVATVPTSTPIPPVTTPPVVTPPVVVSVPPQVWTCISTATLVTCTSPLVAGALP
jgi:hypothetical protein